VKSFADPVRQRKQASRAANEPAGTRSLADFQRAVGNRALARALSAPKGERVLQRWFGLAHLYARASAKTSRSCTVEWSGARGKKTFPIEAFQWAGRRHSAGGGEPRELEKEQLQDFSIVKPLDAVATELMLAATSGTTIAKVEIAYTKGSTRVVHRCRDVLVSSFQPGGEHGDMPSATITFSGIFEGFTHTE
jgi:Type VI secretion system effector, Hcp